MKLGDVIRKEREGKTGLNRRHQLGVAEVAGQLNVPPEYWQTVEAGESPVEKWFPILCHLAVKLQVPPSRQSAFDWQAAQQ